MPKYYYQQLIRKRLAWMLKKAKKYRKKPNVARCLTQAIYRWI